MLKQDHLPINTATGFKAVTLREKLTLLSECLLLPIFIFPVRLTVGCYSARIVILITIRGRAVVKSELVDALNKKFPELQESDVALALDCILAQMVTALIQGERIEIRGFGSFNLRHRSPRIARNPKTGEAVNLPAKVSARFKPGKEMRDRVNTSR